MKLGLLILSSVEAAFVGLSLSIVDIYCRLLKQLLLVYHYLLLIYIVVC